MKTFQHQTGARPQCRGRAEILALALLIAACGSSHKGSAFSIAVVPLVEQTNGTTAAESGWGLISSAALTDSGDVISQPGYATGGWYPVTLPTTVLAGLTANGVYSDLYVGSNLANVDTGAFGGSWWYRMGFVAPQSFANQNVHLHLDRINYRANVWLNGKLVATSDQVAGTFRIHDLDVTALVAPGASNALAIQVFPPNLDKDLAMTWVDWNPPAPDDNTGILGDVYFTRSGSVTVRYPHVSSSLDLTTLASAALTVGAEIVNNGDAPVSATVAGAIENVSFTQDVSLAPHETKQVVFAPADYPQLVLQNPRVWWPAQMGTQELYQLSLTAAVGQETPTTADLRFGIRTVTSELTDTGALLFRVNGKRIFIRGAGWSPDLMLRSDPQRLAAEISYVKDLGLNTIRLEGHLESDHFFDLTDEQGILVLAGWQCCDAWQAWGQWGPEQLAIAKGSMVDQARRLRGHPSVIDFLIGSDQAPPLAIEQMFVQSLKDNDWPNPISGSASETDTPVLGPTGVKMTGPYDWVAPSFWYLDTSGGGAFGFNTETGPGAAIPKVAGLKKMLDAAQLVELLNVDATQQYHAGAGWEYGNLGVFNQALTARYGRSTGLEDYVLKAQLMQYEAERALFEAYGRNKYAQSTGVIHWKLNGAWPSLIWNLYDYDLVPSGSYFGAKKANEALHIQYSYDDSSIVVVNQGPQPAPGLIAKVGVYNLDGSQQYYSETPLDMVEDSVQRLLALPQLPGLSPTYFVKLALDDASGRRSDNFYWLSTNPETIDWSSDRWYAPATLTFADYTGLRGLPATAVTATGIVQSGPDRGQIQVQVTNPSSSVALFLQLELTRGEGGTEVSPVLWEDNDISLLPGETRTVVVSYQLSDLGNVTPAMRLSGWNVPATAIPLSLK